MLISPFLIAGCRPAALAITDLLWLRLPAHGRCAREKRPSDRRGDRGDPHLERARPAREVPAFGGRGAGRQPGQRNHRGGQRLDGRHGRLRARDVSRTSRCSALPRNLGFGGGSNAGFRAAANDIVVLLNNDMRVEPGFLAPLLEGFTDEKVFSVSCQIFFADPARRREETGLTQGWWQDGGLRVRHRVDEGVRGLYPCFYGGGGSSAFDRSKFLELGGFDPLLRALLPGRHRPRLPGLEARLEGALRAAQRGLPRAPRHHRQALQRAARSATSSRRTSSCGPGRTSTSGRGWPRTSSSPGSGALVSVLFGDSPERANSRAASGALSANFPRRSGRAGAPGAWP